MSVESARIFLSAIAVYALVNLWRHRSLFTISFVMVGHDLFILHMQLQITFAVCLFVIYTCAAFVRWARVSVKCSTRRE